MLAPTNPAPPVTRTRLTIGEAIQRMTPMTRFNNEGLDHVAIAVADVERSRRFYADVLGLEREHQEWDVPVVMVARGQRRCDLRARLGGLCGRGRRWPRGQDPPHRLPRRSTRLRRGAGGARGRGLGGGVLRPRDQPLALLQRSRRPRVGSPHTRSDVSDPEAVQRASDRVRELLATTSRPTSLTSRTPTRRSSSARSTTRAATTARTWSTARGRFAAAS